MIKAILFDLDNTLTDFMEMKRRSSEAAVRAMIGAGLPISKDKAIETLYSLFERHGMEDQEIFQKFLRKTMRTIDYKILATGIVAYRKAKTGTLEPYPHVRRTLLELKLHGVTLGILTDAPRMQAWLRLASMQLTDFFDIVITYDDTNKRKPHALPFKKAIEELKLAPKHILMVGDMPQRDIVGAKKAGMQTCFARYGFEGKIGKINADYDVEDISKIINIVQQEKKV